ncbi:MAG: peptide deformylase [Myxococcota bacterium]|nr:peptide deformylase [Myxococcota bacterium]
MTVRKIVVWPDPALAEVAKPVTNFDDGLRTLVADMFDTMYKARGIGLAATQIAVAQRVIVIDLDPRKDGETDPEVGAELASWGYKGPLAVINPEIVSADGDITWNEGCLSVPGITEDVKRREHVLVKAFDKDGKPFELDAHGLFAVCLQHEIDHLNGKMFVDYLSKLKRDVIKRKMVRLKSEETDDGVEAAQNL